MRTSELKGAALDWAVAGCEGYNLEQAWLPAQYALEDFSPSTNWAQAGPIIEREKLYVWWDYPYTDDDGNKYGDHWCAEGGSEDDNIVVVYGNGDTPLIAAMRCYVASKLGDEVHIPEELI